MELVNKVAESGIMTLDLAAYLPDAATLAAFDLKPFLFREMIVREKDFREQVKTYDWQIFQNKHVALFCSVDAVIPVWAYMLITSALKGIAASVHFGTLDNVTNTLIENNLEQLPLADYVDKRVVLKGCGDVTIPTSAYVYASDKLLPVVKSLMYGEPCSTVPVFKKKTN